MTKINYFLALCIFVVFSLGLSTCQTVHRGLEGPLAGWSPFIPGDADNSSLPVGSLEYSFKNRTDSVVKAVFSFNTKNFMASAREGHGVLPIKNGFVLFQKGTEEKPAFSTILLLKDPCQERRFLCH